MAVAITAPASQVAGRSGGVHVAWEPEYPQSAFEILYRRKGAEAWDTFGRVASSASSVDLDLSAFEDFSEYHYRVICYSDNAAQGSTIYSGSDSSAAYSLVVVPENRLAAVKIQYGDGMVEIPVYPDETVTGGVKVALPSGERGEIPLGDPDDALASGLRVSAGGVVKAALGAVGQFADSGVKAGAYMAVKSRYSYSYTNPTYTYVYRYSSTSAVYYYASKYSYTNPAYYYAYRYAETSPTYYYSYRYSVVNPTYYYAYKYSYTNPVYYYKVSYSYKTAESYQSYVYSYVVYMGQAYNYSYYGYAPNYGGPAQYYYNPSASIRESQDDGISPAATAPRYYAYAYGYYKTGGTTAYAYKYASGGGGTSYAYKYSSGGGGSYYAYKYDSGGGGSYYAYKYGSGGGGTGYAYKYLSGGGTTTYGYRYRTGGGGTGYGYRYRTEYRYA